MHSEQGLISLAMFRLLLKILKYTRKVVCLDQNISIITPSFSIIGKDLIMRNIIILAFHHYHLVCELILPLLSPIFLHYKKEK